MRRRVLFLLACPASNASSRYRVIKYLPGLAEVGIDCHIREPLPGGLARLQRFETGNLTHRAIYYFIFLICRLVDVLRAGRYDVVVVQRDLFPFSLGLMEKVLHRLQNRVVYDTDDAMHIAPSFMSKRIFQRLRPLSKFNEMMRAARYVVVANEPLRQHAITLNPRVAILPMAVDLERYTANNAGAESAEGALVLGWTGTAASFNYLGILREPLELLSREIPLVLEIVSGSNAPFELGSVPIRRKTWRIESEIEDLRSFQIGLLPLPDTQFERGKFPFKLLQYMALGLPVVASPVGTVSSLVQHGVTGYLARSSDEWLEHIRALASDPQLGRKMGNLARRVVEQQFSIRACTQIWRDVIEESAGPSLGRHT